MFGVLQSRFAIIRDPTCFWDVDKMKNIIYACIILYNMIVEDKPDTYQNNIDYNSVGNNMSTLIGAHPSMRSTYFQRRAEVHYKQRHHQLQADLVEYIWEHFRNENNN